MARVFSEATLKRICQRMASCDHQSSSDIFSGPGQGNIKGLSLWSKGKLNICPFFRFSLRIFLEILCCSIMTPPYRAETAKSALPFVPCIIHCCNSRRIIGAHRHHHRCNIQHTSVNIQLILNLKNEIKSINSYSQNSVKWICGKGKSGINGVKPGRRAAN